MANMIGALVGAAIDRQDGDSGIKGAIVGTIAESAIRTLVPIIATYAVGWIVLNGIQKAVAAASDSAAELLTGSDDTMATLPPDPYAPDPVHNPDGTVTTPAGQPETLPGPVIPAPPPLDPDDAANVPVNQPPGSAGL